MYGMTEKVVNYVESILQREGIKYNKLKMPLATESEMVATVFRSAGVIIGAPTYEYKLFPPVASALNELGRKRITGKTAFRFGSYGWSGGAEKELAEIIERNNMKWNFIESVEFEGAPKDEDLARVEERVLEFIKKMREKVATVEIKGNAYYKGMKIALFDVSDVTNPIQKFSEIIGDRGTDPMF